MQRLKPAQGNWVDGDRFWDRVEETALFLRFVREGAHLLLVAQRRMGKTSLMKQVSRLLAVEFECVFVDFQNAATPQDAIAELSLALQPHKSLWAQAKELFASILDRVERVGGEDLAVSLRDGVTGGDWSVKGDGLFDILAKAEKPVLLLIDEIPILVNRIIKGWDYRVTPERRQLADEFMCWLRKNSQKHQGRIRIVLSGSIGLEPVLHQAGLSATINNFKAFQLGPWSEDTAVGCLRALATECGLEYVAGTEEAMVRRLGCCIPHHVQMFFDHARTFCERRGSRSIGPEQVQDIYETEMLSTRGHAELTHYEERLKLVLGAGKMALAVELLTEAAVCGVLSAEAIRRLQNEYAFDGETTADVQREILWTLEHDGYLVQTATGFGFVSHLLKDWWRARYQAFFTPVLKRGV